MRFYNRLVEYHEQSRSSFILFTEFAAFIGVMATIVGMGILREMLL